MDLSVSSSSRAMMKILEDVILQKMFKESKFVDRIIFLLEEEHFTKPQNRLLFRIFHDFYGKYRRGPSGKEYKVELVQALENLNEADRPSVLETLEKVLNLAETADSEYVLDKAEEFVRQADIRKALAEAGQAYSEGDISVALDCMRKPFLRTNPADVHSLEFLSTFDERIRMRKEFETMRRIPTKLPSLDVILGGGHGVGELGTVLAPTNVGKSQALINFGASALEEQKVTLYVTLELSKLKVFSRMDSRLTDIPVNFLTHEEVQLRAREEGLKQYKDLFYCQEFPSGSISIEKLVGFVKNFKRSRGHLDLLLLDYADLLSMGKNQDLRIALGNIYKLLRGLASEEQVAIWTCTQSNRAGFTAEHVSEIHSAESIDKMFVADVVVSLNQKPEEYPNRMRLFVVKARDASKWTEIALRCDFSRAKWWQDTNSSGGRALITAEQEEHVKEMLRRGAANAEGSEEQAVQESRAGT